MKSNQMLYIIYADIESLFKKIDRYANDPEKSSTTNIGKHIPCGYSLKKKHTLYRGEGCVKEFFSSL